MNINRLPCINCYGTGKTKIWKMVSIDEKNGVGRLESEEVVCETCNGKGYNEYPSFTVEEAKAILKHCGLSTES